MDNFNKVFSFILGLIVVVVFLAVVTNRLNLREKIAGLRGKNQSRKEAINPSQGLKPTEVLVKTGRETTSSENKDFHSYQKPRSIPATGVSTMAFVLTGIGFIGGSYLRKKT